MTAGKTYGLFYTENGEERLVWRFKSQSQARVAFGKGKNSNVHNVKRGPYATRAITSEEVTACKVDPDEFEKVCGIIDKGSPWTIAACESDMKKCERCNESKAWTSDNFPIENGKLRGTCRACRIARNREFRANRDTRVAEKAASGATTFLCKGVENMIDAHDAPISDMRSDTMQQCRSCKNKAMVALDAKKRAELSTEEARAQFDGVFAECITCHQVKNVGRDFVVKAGRQNNGVCKRCTLDKGYWKKHREKRRAVSPLRFYENNAKVRRTWAACNPDKMKVYNDNRRTSSKDRWSSLITKCSRKAIPLALEEEKELSELFMQPCSYCGHEPSDTLNGLDRIIWDSGYCLKNVLPSCHICNLIKGTMTLEAFFGMITKMESVNPEVEPSTTLPMTRRCGKGDGDAKSITPTLQKAAQNLVNQLENASCYLCGILRSDTPNGKIGIDRVDSCGDYTPDNCEPCCWTCNRAKSDFQLGPFLAHVKRMALYMEDTLNVEDTHQKAESSLTETSNVPAIRKTNMPYKFMEHGRAKPVIVIDTTTENVVAKFGSIVELERLFRYETLRDKLKSGSLLFSRWQLQRTTSEHYDMLTIDPDVSDGFIEQAFALAPSERKYCKVRLSFFKSGIYKHFNTPKDASTFLQTTTQRIYHALSNFRNGQKTTVSGWTLSEARDLA